MNRIPTRTLYEKHYVHIFRNNRLVYGFSEADFPLALLKDHCKSEKIVQLKQVHGNQIINSSEITDDSQADGIILDQTGVIAVIKTADCVPLFFWSDDFSTAGILHIGWKGLLSEINKNLLLTLINRGVKPENLNFFTGPGIEACCYEVGNDLWLKFINNKHQQKIFTPYLSDKYKLDLKKGITLSLLDQDIKPTKIFHSAICTKCDNRFPSYRRQKTGNNRLYNFVTLQ